MKKRVALLVVLITFFVLLAPFAWMMVPVELGGINHGRVSKKRVALTFDDGPNPAYSQRIVTLLNRYGAKGTFFALGRNLQAHRTTALKLIASGHQIANHGYSHQALSELPFTRQKEEILATDEILKNLGVSGRIAFRPPYGELGWRLRYWLWQTGRGFVLWSKNAFAPDYFRHDPRELAAKWIQAVQPGAILLLHDGEGHRPETVEALDALLTHLNKSGYQAVTLNELL